VSSASGLRGKPLFKHSQLGIHFLVVYLCSNGIVWYETMRCFNVMAETRGYMNRPSPRSKKKKAMSKWKKTKRFLQYKFAAVPVELMHLPLPPLCPPVLVTRRSACEPEMQGLSAILRGRGTKPEKKRVHKLSDQTIYSTVHACLVCVSPRSAPRAKRLPGTRPMRHLIFIRSSTCKSCCITCCRVQRFETHLSHAWQGFVFALSWSIKPLPSPTPKPFSPLSTVCTTIRLCLHTIMEREKPSHCLPVPHHPYCCRG